MADLPLTKLSETATTLTLGWTPPAGAVGYVFYNDAKRSSTLDGTRSTVKFSKGAAIYRVRALGVVAEGEFPPVVPPVVQQPPLARTNYAAVANGGLDPMWQAHGRHMGAGCYIGAEADPLGGAFRVQRHTVVDGGVFSGGERAEVLNTNLITTPTNGGRFQVGFKLLLPVGFQASGSDWNGLCQMHYAGGILQSPWMMGVRNQGTLFYRTIGGPLNQDGTMGTIVNTGNIATLAQGVWHTILMDVALELTNGIFDVWLNGTRILNLRASTLSSGAGNNTYWKQGFYRKETDSGSNTYYFGDTLCWKNQSPDAMLAHYGYGGSRALPDSDANG